MGEMKVSLLLLLGISIVHNNVAQQLIQNLRLQQVQQGMQPGMQTFSMQPAPGSPCQRDGQFVRDANNHCIFYKCTLGIGGFEANAMSCARGTGVPNEYGMSQQYPDTQNPCTRLADGRGAQCGEETRQLALQLNQQRRLSSNMIQNQFNQNQFNQNQFNQNQFNQNQFGQNQGTRGIVQGGQFFNGNGQLISGSQRCFGGQVFSRCGSTCVRTCANQSPRCTSRCVARCQCPYNRPILHNGQCIQPYQCPNTRYGGIAFRNRGSQSCTGGQIFSQCASQCPRTCFQTSRTCNLACRPGCACPPFRPYLHNGQCHDLNQCRQINGGVNIGSNIGIGIGIGQTCSGGQIYTQCMSKCGVKTCFNMNQNQNCNNLAPCQAGCECPSTRPFLHNGQCRSMMECQMALNGNTGISGIIGNQQCSGGQIYSTCSSGCTKTCYSVNQLCQPRCTPGCECPPSRPFVQNGICVASISCPLGSPGRTSVISGSLTCSGGQIYTQCMSKCGVKTCFNMNQNQNCNNLAACQAGCECPSTRPFLHNGQCRTMMECQMALNGNTGIIGIGGNQQCSGGQIYSTCSSGCTKTCYSVNQPCQPRCTPGCECPPSRPFVHNGRCVDQFRCPLGSPGRTTAVSQRCSGGQVYSTCSSGCTKTCYSVNQPCQPRCTPGCECPPSRPFVHNGQCVDQFRCPLGSPGRTSSIVGQQGTFRSGSSGIIQPGLFQAITCPAGQTYDSCATNCQKTCYSPNPVCQVTGCVPGCVCPLSRPFEDGGQCKTAFECPVGSAGRNQAGLSGGGNIGLNTNTNIFSSLIASVGNQQRGLGTNNAVTCVNGQQYSSCAPAVIPTCDNPNPTSNRQCSQGCACPPTAPLFHNNRCMQQAECPPNTLGRTLLAFGNMGNTNSFPNNNVVTSQTSSNVNLMSALMQGLQQG